MSWKLELSHEFWEASAYSRGNLDSTYRQGSLLPPVMQGIVVRAYPSNMFVCHHI